MIDEYPDFWCEAGARKWRTILWRLHLAQNSSNMTLLAYLAALQLSVHESFQFMPTIDPASQDERKLPWAVRHGHLPRPKKYICNEW